ncbi:hypothetical protein [Cupriavidus plantarum]|uniref:Uncharacterized protein n=1 Tax=Cupriavidus plantarum TaxID=942865 RepID=A0A316EZX3_9BURK|nr:hypothetical protein [Cupriavidus plantarum]NYH99799.1 hypothetical protein [Cupriavidus plantarum]PWK36998.1 hypothetical protein C7419_101874 [Cupriavidus plantarum]REF02263.1 hypothetical protein C7418_1061 [Cupriavidus plantarum]RLK44881.1 hypothetical protein C7417_0881 [Cupriavidus plantarum]CAG2152310.1 hypothetical protein LMG26296_05115 [Cupriavidus plantarum]
MNGHTRWRWLMWVLWPAFLVAGVATAAVFSLVDPRDLMLFGHPLDASREAVYTVGFLVAWGLCAVSSGLTLYTLPAPLAETDELA